MARAKSGSISSSSSTCAEGPSRAWRRSASCSLISSAVWGGEGGREGGGEGLGEGNYGGAYKMRL